MRGATFNHEGVTVICNHVPRFTVDAYELEPRERLEFDYLDWEALERGEDSASFIRYRGVTYDLGDLEGPIVVNGTQWDAHLSDTFFSGILVRWILVDGDYSVIVARYYS